jgi:anaerobic ribonucleoside-triphosphate reductase activating protein
MKVAHIEKSSYIYGPGKRFVIWTQGCSIRCKGCWNEDMWDFEGGKNISITEIIELIKSDPEVEGITILGGEPFDQFEELKKLVDEISKNKITLIIYTGYELEEIHEKQFSEILNKTDILITGRYIEKLRVTDKQWIGSTNQKIMFLTDRYDNTVLENACYAEILIDEFGKIRYLGFPDDLLEQ